MRAICLILAVLCVGSAADNVSYTVNPNTNFTRQPPAFNSTGCFLIAKDPFMMNRVKELADMGTKLLNYNISFPDYPQNPLLTNMRWTYKANSWSRVSNQHGQTLLSLAFNYGVLSLMTLTFGVESINVELEDSIPGCFGNLTETNKIDATVHLLMRDFNQVPDVSFLEDERICHEIISVEKGVAVFRDRCCHVSRINGEQSCTTDWENIWLTLLHIMLSMVRYGLLFFGPILFIPAVESMAKDQVPYSVKLKEPLQKTIYLARDETPVRVKYKFKLDFRRCAGFFKLRESAAEYPLGEPVKVQISQYDIDVCYKSLLTENEVPVGLWTCICRQIFLCKLKNLSPFRRCCESNMLRTCPNRNAIPWKWLWQKIGLLLMLICIPLPLYLRVTIFYVFEYDEVMHRKTTVAELGYEENYQNNLTHYLTPTHWIFICVYFLYFITAIILAYMARKTEEGRFRKIIIGAFRDLKNQSWVNLLKMVITNLIWPFKRYGLAGCGVAIVYWPIALPLSLIVYLLYTLPSVYVTFRMFAYSKLALVDPIQRSKKKKRSYRVRKNVDQSLKAFEAGKILDDGASLSTKSGRRGSQLTIATMQIPPAWPPRRDMNWRRFFEHLFAAVLCVLTMYGMLLVLSECVGCMVEIFVFTMMGVIVNAGAILKYCTLIFLVVLYSYSCFNNVPKKYLKLNKSLFNEVKGRIKDLDQVTSLPSYLQENFGFKAQEISEQADYESPDEVVKKLPLHWMINDLVLFIDNEDMPRIPKKLFEDVCQIRVAGSPGPVYRSHMEALHQFLMIVMFLLFVFIIVLSFGAVYKVSSTNQMAATMAGGFLPFVLKTFMQPSKPDIELGTVSFKSKCDEIIKNFYQYWPIYDFPFETPTEEEEEDEDKDKDKDKDGDGDGEKTDKKDEKKDETKKDKENNNEKESNDKKDSQPPPPAYKEEFEMQDMTNKDQADSALLKKTLALPGEEDAPAPPFTSSKEDQQTAFAIMGELYSPQDEVEEVDYLIFLPEVFDEYWLQEWSDIEEYEKEPMSTKQQNVEPPNDLPIKDVLIV